MTITTTMSPTAQALVRGFNRAVAEKLVIYRVNPTMLGVASVMGAAPRSWIVKPYELRIIGPRPQDVTCSCPAGERGTICKHRALAIYCRKHNIYALKPAARHATV